MLAGHDPHYVGAIWIVASGFGIAALAALVVIYRRAVRRSELELAERVIAEHDHSSS